MTRHKLESPIDQPIEILKNLLLEEIEAMACEAGSSAQGQGPDAEGRYSSSRSSDKERRETLLRLPFHDRMLAQPIEEAQKQFATGESWIKAFADHIQCLDPSVSEPICRFIEIRFNLAVPRKDPARVRFENLVNSATQLLTLSREEIQEKLGNGTLSPDEVDNRLSLLFRNYSK